MAFPPESRMFQEIEPHRIDLTYSLQEARDGDQVIAFAGTRLLMATDETGPRLPAAEEIAGFDPDAGTRLYRLFSVDGGAAVYAYIGEARETNTLKAVNVMSLRHIDPAWRVYVWVTAVHLAQWYLSNRFCGACGGTMSRKEDERALVCSGCAQIVYPRISPGVIVGLVDGGRILLTRYNRPESRLTALVAGFVEVGETYEDAVRREVMEEVGLRVKNIRYYKSQPWSFSGSLLAGFYADLDGPDALTVDYGELAEARWMERDELPNPPDTFSLTAELIETFRQGKHEDFGAQPNCSEDFGT